MTNLSGANLNNRAAVGPQGEGKDSPSSFPKYPAYKDSGVEWLGAVPEHWALTPIKHLALLNPRKSGFDGDTGQNCSFIPMEKLKTGGLLLDEERPVSEVIDGYTYFEDGDVLQAKVTPCFENKNVAVARGLTNGVGFGSSEINVLRPCANVSAEFLYYRVQEDSYMGFCTASMIGAGGLKRVPSDIINNFKVAAPELAEQTQIARFLDHETARIDALIKEQQRLIELLREKRQAVISHAVTKGLYPSVPMKDSGVEWLGEVPAHWSTLQVGRVCRKVSDGPHFSPDYVDEGVLFLSARNIAVDGWHLEDAKFVSEEDYLEFCRRIIPEKGDVLYTKGGTTGIARVVDLDERFQVWVHVAVLKLDQDLVDPYYMAFSLNSVGCYEQSQLHTRGATNQDLGLTRMTKIWFALPPLEEQTKICDFLNLELGNIDSLSSEATTVMELLTERRSALISAAVTGKIDLRGWQPPASTPDPIRVQETA